MVAMEITVTMATERVINISQYKPAAVSYLNSQYLSYFQACKARIWYEDTSPPNSQFR